MTSGRQFAHNSTKKSRRSTKISSKIVVSRLTFHTSSKVKRSKVKVSKPLGGCTSGYHLQRAGRNLAAALQGAQLVLFT